MRRAFFFPHALQPGDVPGRVPFDVRAQLVGATTGEHDVVVCADGFAANTVGTNQDPCVFAAPGVFHSFCRINGVKPSDNAVRGRGKPLSHVVRAGDVIFYGKFEPRGGPGPTELVWIDTVLVVASVVPWVGGPRYAGSECKNPACKKAKKFVLSSPTMFAEKLAGLPAGGGRASAAYGFNLSDAERSGMHCCNSLADYKVIVGACTATNEALANLETSFVTLADQENGLTRPASVRTADVMRWRELAEFLDRDVRLGRAGPRGGWIAEFPDFSMAEELARALVTASGASQGKTGAVSVPPLHPLGVTRFDPRDAA
jgi:hypothetical protein